MTNHVISTSYIISLDEFLFFSSLKAFRQLRILGIQEIELNLVRNATAMMSLEAKGFLSRFGGRLDVEPVIADLLSDLCDIDPSIFEIGDTVQGKNLTFSITAYPLQTATYRITILGATHETVS